MIIVLKPHTSDEGIEKIKNLIVATGTFPRCNG